MRSVGLARARIAPATVFLSAALLAAAPLSSQLLATSPAPTAAAPSRDGAWRGSALAQEAGGAGPLLLIEPFAGRLFFADALGGERQELLGVGGGVEFTRYFALRGYYWRGMSRGFDAIQPLQSYGAEAQFTFRAPGVFTFLIAGAGHLGLSGAAEGAADALPLEQHALIVGGGLGVALGQRLRVHAAVRDYIARGDGPEDAGAAERLLHNPLLSVGLTLVLGGERPRRLEERQWEQTHRQRLDEDLQRAFAERDRFMARLQEPRTRTAEIEPDAERMITIPVPRQGEIYIRYGQPGGVRIESEARAVPREQPSLRLEDRGLSAAELREVIRAVVQEEVWRARSLSPLPAPAPAPARPLTPLDPRVEDLEERLLRRIDELIEQRLREREQGPLPVPAPPDR